MYPCPTLRNLEELVAEVWRLARRTDIENVKYMKRMYMMTKRREERTDLASSSLVVDAAATAA
jgi:hypothetical protein